MANPELDEMLAAATAAVGRMADLNDDYEAIRAQAADPRNLVTATVNGAGGLVGLRLDPASLRLGASELGDLIASTALSAAQRAFARRAAITEEFQSELGAADNR